MARFNELSAPSEFSVAVTKRRTIRRTHSLKEAQEKAAGAKNGIIQREEWTGRFGSRVVKDVEISYHPNRGKRWEVSVVTHLLIADVDADPRELEELIKRRDHDLGKK